MKYHRSLLLILALFFSALVVFAQDQFSAWPYFAEVSTNGNQGLYKFTVPLHVLGQAREDLGDLRLFDANNHEIPYAINVRKDIEEQNEAGASVFNEVSVGSATEATIDLGENPAEHNQVQIETAGTDFRRRVTVEGSDSGTGWRTLRSDAVIVAFASEGQSAESNRVTYPTARYRYLRVRVNSDELYDDHPPDVTGLKVFMTVHQKGELATWDVNVPVYQLLRNQGAYASSWLIDLGARVPCDRLSLNISDQSFYRPFQVESVDDPQNPQLLASGNLSRRANDRDKMQVITFDHEAYARKIRLQITDYSNPVLSIETIQASAPAREIVFDLKQPQTVPLRLYFGNAKVDAPHYDFEKELSSALKSMPQQSSVSGSNRNPAYVPEPLPFTERVPWLIYLVLAASSAALGWILWSLTRKAMKLETEPASTGNRG